MKATRREIQASPVHLKIIKQIRKEFKLNSDSKAIEKTLYLYSREFIPLKRDYKALSLQYDKLLSIHNEMKTSLTDFILGFERLTNLANEELPF